jgi:hypothetical protein
MLVGKLFKLGQDPSKCTQNILQYRMVVLFINHKTMATAEYLESRDLYKIKYDNIS